MPQILLVRIIIGPILINLENVFIYQIILEISLVLFTSTFFSLQNDTKASLAATALAELSFFGTQAFDKLDQK